MYSVPLAESLASDDMPLADLRTATRVGFRILVPENEHEASAILDVVSTSLTLHGHHFISTGQWLTQGVVVCEGELGKALVALSVWEHGDCLFINCPDAGKSWMFHGLYGRLQ